LTSFDFVLWACSSDLVSLGLGPFDKDIGVASGSVRDCFVLDFETLLAFFKAVEDMANRQIIIFNLWPKADLSKQRSTMNIPPFTNSHSLYEQQTATVDRATLFPQSTCLVANDGELAQLDELVRANLGDLDVSNTRKRRKHTNSGEGQSALHETHEPTRKPGLPCLYDYVN
jgi:hypothetical protein